MITWSQWVTSNRKHEGMSRKQLADRIGVHQQTVSGWERGLHSPDVYARGKLTELFGDMP